MKKPNIKQAVVPQPDALLAAAEQRESRTDRTNFSYEIKARIFARDRAICAFTGINLWLLDDGACGYYNFGSADHIIPATRGGLSDEENGIATHVAWNYEKGNNADANIYLFNGGFPTMNYWVFNRVISPEIAQRLVRFGQIHPSDCHFNSAIACVLSGVQWLHLGKDEGRKRDDAYHAGATLNHLVRWRRSVVEDKVASLEERNLALEPLFPDQALFLSVREMMTEKQIKKLMQDILPYHVANYDVTGCFMTAYNAWLEGNDYPFDHVMNMMEGPFVSPILIENIVSNIQMLIDPFAPWGDDEALKKYDEEQESGEVN